LIEQLVEENKICKFYEKSSAVLGFAQLKHTIWGVRLAKAYGLTKDKLREEVFCGWGTRCVWGKRSLLRDEQKFVPIYSIYSMAMWMRMWSYESKIAQFSSQKRVTFGEDEISLKPEYELVGYYTNQLLIKKDRGDGLTGWAQHSCNTSQIIYSGLHLCINIILLQYFV
ncbi:hypothetical protein ACJX0J_025685, partial [Zea mays]